VNNSVFGPLYPLHSVLNKINATENCVLSITENVEREYHLQSYFLLVPRKVFTGKVFTRFWKNFLFLDKRLNVVYGYEMGLSRALKRSGVELRAFCPTAAEVYGNPTYLSWFELVRDMKCPYIKRDLLRKKGMSTDDVSAFFVWLKLHTPYDPLLISGVKAYGEKH
jgi:lipopolysaccharide biosynthesis protein